MARVQKEFENKKIRCSEVELYKRPAKRIHMLDHPYLFSRQLRAHNNPSFIVTYFVIFSSLLH